MAAYRAVGVRMPILCARILINKLRYTHLHKGSKLLCISSQVQNFDGNNRNSRSSDRENQSESYYGTEEEVKHKILNAALSFVHEHGWTKYAIAAGAETVGFPGVAHGMFPKGGMELVSYFYHFCNRNLEDELKVKLKDTGDITKNQLKQFLSDAVKLRLQMILPYLNKWPQAVAIMALPQNILHELKNTMDIVDTIWYCGGDRSVTFDWYTKRLALAAVYKSTELCFLQDSSPNQGDTWEFLNRQLDNMFLFRKCTIQARNNFKITGDTLSGGFTTICNMMGFNHLLR